MNDAIRPVAFESVEVALDQSYLVDFPCPEDILSADAIDALEFTELYPLLDAYTDLLAQKKEKQAKIEAFNETFRTKARRIEFEHNQLVELEAELEPYINGRDMATIKGTDAMLGLKYEKTVNGIGYLQAEKEKLQRALDAVRPQVREQEQETEVYIHWLKIAIAHIDYRIVYFTPRIDDHSTDMLS